MDISGYIFKRKNKLLVIITATYILATLITYITILSYNKLNLTITKNYIIASKGVSINDLIDIINIKGLKNSLQNFPEDISKFTKNYSFGLIASRRSGLFSIRISNTFRRDDYDIEMIEFNKFFKIFGDHYSEWLTEEYNSANFEELGDWSFNIEEAPLLMGTLESVTEAIRNIDNLSKEYSVETQNINKILEFILKELRESINERNTTPFKIVYDFESGFKSDSELNTLIFNIFIKFLLIYTILFVIFILIVIFSRKKING